MTTPSFNPEEQTRLQEYFERKQNPVSAPIDTEANSLVEYLVHVSGDPEFDNELITRGIDFVSNLVGWSSSKLDESTGQIRIADFDIENEQDEQLDRLGVDFLSNSKSVTTSELITDSELNTQYSFHQIRKNGTVRYITVHRKEALDASKIGNVRYCLSYEDVGEYSDKAESRLDLFRAFSLGGAALELSVDASKAVYGSTVGKLVEVFSKQS